MATEIDLPEDLRVRVARDFGSHARHVVERLTAFKAESSSIATDRILRCIVQASKGDEASIQRYVDLAKKDWRDLITAAEYQYPDVRLRDLSEPFDS